MSQSNENDLSSENPTAKAEFAYLDRGGFSSEKFKIEIRGLPKFYGIAELKKVMSQKLSLKPTKVKRPKMNSHWLYVCFQNDEERTKAVAALNGYIWKGKKLIAEEAKPAPDPLIVKRKHDIEEGDGVKKKKEEENCNNGTQEEKLKNATTPYWNLSYDEQITLKQKTVHHTLSDFDNEMWKIDKGRRNEIESNRKTNDGLSFSLKPIERSPVIDGYRNKCEFTVGVDYETNLPTVGFRLGSYVKGTVEVAPVSTLKHIPEKTKDAVLLFQEFVRKSKLPPFCPADYTGYWKVLTVRQSSTTGHLMLIVSIHPQELTLEERANVMEELTKYFSGEEAVACGIKSLYFAIFTKRSPGQVAPKLTHLLGDTHITDNILGRQFRISPGAFFQVNTSGAEVLYQRAIDISEVTKNTTLVDICCGTGTIGLCFAQHCKKVIGLEMVSEAIDDARANAKLNGVDNCEFFVGKAEDTLSDVLRRVRDEDLVAVVDPPRAGLHMRAITQLRNNQQIKSLIYISCSPASAIKNWVDLSRPTSKTMRGVPFIPIMAVPVDMFPHTKHIELIILFRRKEVSNSTNIEEQNESVQLENDAIGKAGSNVNQDSDVNMDMKD